MKHETKDQACLVAHKLYAHLLEVVIFERKSKMQFLHCNDTWLRPWWNSFLTCSQYCDHKTNRLRELFLSWACLDSNATFTILRTYFLTFHMQTTVLLEKFSANLFQYLHHNHAILCTVVRNLKCQSMTSSFFHNQICLWIVFV